VIVEHELIAHRKAFYQCDAMYVCFPLLSHTSESYTCYSTVSLSGNLISKSENVILPGIIGDPSALYGSVKFLKTIQQIVLFDRKRQYLQSHAPRKREGLFLFPLSAASRDCDYYVGQINEEDVTDTHTAEVELNDSI
jgi:hypothetical protein